MNSHHYLAAFLRLWPFVAAAAVIAGLIALALSQAATPAYTANAKLYFSLSVGGSATDLNQGSSYIQGQMASYAQLAMSPTVLKPVADELDLQAGPDELARSIEVTTPQNTAILEIAVTNRSAAEAARIANALASSLVSTVKEISPTTPEEGASVSPSIIESATEPTEPTSPNTPRNLLAGIVIGLILGVLAVVLRERFDTRLRSAEQLAAASSVPLLGVIEPPSVKRKGQAQDVPRNLESYRRLCAQLDAGNGKPLSLLVVFPTARERNSAAVLGIATAFTERRRRVVVVEGDLRNSRLAELSGLDNTEGLSAVLRGEASAADVIGRWDERGFDVLLSGQPSARPGELLASPAAAALFKQLSASHDVVLVDAAPVDVVADAMVLGRQVHAAVVFTSQNRTRLATVTRALDALAGAHVKVLGVVFNEG